MTRQANATPNPTRIEGQRRRWRGQRSRRIVMLSQYVSDGWSLREIGHAEHCSHQRAMALLRYYDLYDAWKHASQERRMRRRLLAAIREHGSRFRPPELTDAFIVAAEKRGLKVTAPPRTAYSVLIEDRRFHLHRPVREHKPARGPDGKSRTYLAVTLCADVLHVICFPDDRYFFVLPTSDVMRDAPTRNGRRRAQLYFRVDKPLPEENWPSAKLIRESCPMPKGVACAVQHEAVSDQRVRAD